MVPSERTMAGIPPSIHLIFRLVLLLAAISSLHAAYSPGVSVGLGRTGAATTTKLSSSKTGASCCTSNATHIGWPVENNKEGIFCQTWSDAVRDCLLYLRSNLMPFDVPNAGTLGFPTVKTTEADEQATEQRLLADENGQDRKRQQELLPDGLDDGIINRTIHLALSTKILHPWTASVPRGIFYEYVLNFCATNEARSNWRLLLTEAMEPVLQQLKKDTNNTATLEHVVETINRHLWIILARDPSKPIYFKGGQTPLVFDPMSVVAFGYGSCTGLSILFVFALRSAGVPARLVGTPAWWGKAENGNHNWVEVWTPSAGWRFLEPAMGDYGGDVDNLDRDPCKRWFCNKDRFGNGKTRVYAARYTRQAGGTVYPLAWDLENKDVPGEDRTSYYEEVCGKCP